MSSRAAGRPMPHIALDDRRRKEGFRAKDLEAEGERRGLA